MLYIWIRMARPEHVIEVGTLCGTSARWIIAALEKNGAGHLRTYDLFNYSLYYVPRTVPTDRWTFDGQLGCACAAKSARNASVGAARGSQARAAREPGSVSRR